jgi:hypothetical protein
MIAGNTGTIVTALEAEVSARLAGDRLPSVRELMARHRAGPATVQRAIATLSARGLVEARPGAGRSSPHAPRPARPTPRGRRSRLAHGRSTPTRWRTLLRPPPPGAYVLSSGYLPADLQPTAALVPPWPARRGGRGRGTGCAEGLSGAARVLRVGGRRRRDRRRRPDLPWRSGGARGVPARSGGAGRAGDRRGADLPGRAHRRARAGPRADPGAGRRARHPARPAGGALGAPARGWSTCSRSSPTRTGRRWPSSGARPCSRPCGGRGVPGRGRRVPRSGASLRRRAPCSARTRTATSCTCAHSPSRPHRACGSAP